jgi:hypothetical protein
MEGRFSALVAAVVTTLAVVSCVPSSLSPPTPTAAPELRLATTPTLLSQASGSLPTRTGGGGPTNFAFGSAATPASVTSATTGITPAQAVSAASVRPNPTTAPAAAPTAVLVRPAATPTQSIDAPTPVPPTVPLTSTPSPTPSLTPTRLPATPTTVGGYPGAIVPTAPRVPTQVGQYPSEPPTPFRGTAPVPFPPPGYASPTR